MVKSPKSSLVSSSTSKREASQRVITNGNNTQQNGRRSLAERLSIASTSSTSQTNKNGPQSRKSIESNHQQDGLKVKLLTDVQRKEALVKYRKIYDQIKNTDAENDEFRMLLERLRLNIEQQNQCLLDTGINDLVVMDAKCMAMTTELSVGLVKKFNTCSKFDSKSFVKSLKKRLIKHSNTAGVLASISSKREKINLRFEHLYGAGLVLRKYHYQTPALVKGFRQNVQAPVEQKKRQTQRQQLPTNVKSTQPTQFDSKKDNVDESDKRLSQIYARLKKLQQRNNNSVPFVQASINPASFSTTVENFFNMSFLARQSLISITATDQDGTMNVSKLSKSSSKNNKDSTKKKTADDDEEQDETDDSDGDITIEPMVRIIEPEDGQEDVDEDEEISAKIARLTKLNKQLDRSDDIQSILSLDTDVYRTLIDKLEITRAALK